MKITDERRRVHDMKDQEIDIELRELRERLFSLRSQAVTEKVTDTSQYRKARTQIARLLTERTARETAAADKANPADEAKTEKA